METAQADCSVAPGKVALVLNLGREEVEPLGLAVEDLAAARHVWRKAREA